MPDKSDFEKAFDFGTLREDADGAMFGFSYQAHVDAQSDAFFGTIIMRALRECRFEDAYATVNAIACLTGMNGNALLSKPCMDYMRAALRLNARIAPVKTPPPLYGYSADGEGYHGKYASRAEAVDAARKHLDEQWFADKNADHADRHAGLTVQTARCVFPVAADLVTDATNFFDAEAITENLDEAALDKGFSVPDGDPLFEIDETELEKHLTECLKKYLADLNPTPTHYSTDDVKDHEL